jgi:hypothetical protein
LTRSLHFNNRSVSNYPLGKFEEGLSTISSQQDNGQGSHTGLTLTAFYGEKPKPFEEFLVWCQDLVGAQAGDGFIPYEIEQVHATIVGLESRWLRGRQVNENLFRLGQVRPMDLPGMAHFLESTARLPMQVRIGGFHREKSYDFESFGKHPYERTFEIQQNDTVVAMGWPFEGSSITNALYELRRELLQFNVLHKYHMTAGCEDNDLFFVIGRMDSRMPPHWDRVRVSDHIRSQVAGMKPMLFDVERANLSFVRYHDRRLPLSSSIRLRLEDAEFCI